MIDVSTEEVVSLAEAASRLPRRRAGKKPHPCTLYRWTTGGLRGVRLESVQIGGTRCTSFEALTRFFGALTDQARLTGGGSVDLTRRAAGAGDFLDREDQRRRSVHDRRRQATGR